jgi:N-acetylglucosaminyl-diphospho-decaprenol L-rhamnosyltransferase
VRRAGAGEDVRARPGTPVYLDERNKMLLTRDLYAARLPMAAAAAGLIVLRYAARWAWRQALRGLAGWWAGLRNRRGRPGWIAA